jgi:hypothetical protein
VGAQIANELANDTAAVSATNAPRLEYLMSFDQGVSGALALLSKVATTASSEQLREDADFRLVAQAANWSRYTPVSDPGDIAAWQAFFNNELAISTSSAHFITLWNAVTSLNDVAALPTLATKLHTITFNNGGQSTLVCQAYSLSQAQPGSWTAFQAAAQPWTTLPADVQSILADPTHCATTMSATVSTASVRAAAVTSTAANGLPVNRPDAHIGQHRRPPLQ